MKSKLIMHSDWTPITAGYTSAAAGGWAWLGQLSAGLDIVVALVSIVAGLAAIWLTAERIIRLRAEKRGEHGDSTSK